MEEKILYEKFIEGYEVKNYEVLTPNGWINIEGIGKTIEFEEWYLLLDNGDNIICADKHILYRCDNMDFNTKKCDLTEIFCEELIIGDFIMTKTGPEMIMELYKNGKKSHMYDLQISEGSNKQYYTNNILSHNSLWMQNFATKIANDGNNVLYITLEMSEKKVLKRLGSIRLKIPINDYDDLSTNKEFIKKRIDNLKNSSENSDDLFEKKIGKIITKFWAAGTSTVNDFDFFIQKLKDKANIIIDFIIVDYIALIAPNKGTPNDNLYSKGKSIAEGLRALANKYDCPLLTAVQVAKDAWNASDITLESVPESKAIVETADSFWAIIRTAEMRKINLYRFKLLKQRDGDFANNQIKININPIFLSLENDSFLS
jgi:hypothetical protein